MQCCCEQLKGGGQVREADKLSRSRKEGKSLRALCRPRVVRIVIDYVISGGYSRHPGQSPSERGHEELDQKVETSRRQQSDDDATTRITGEREKKEKWCKICGQPAALNRRYAVGQLALYAA